MKRGLIGFALLAVALVGALIFTNAIGDWFAKPRAGRSVAVASSSAPAVAAPGRFSPPRLLRVGVIVSDYSANGPNWMGRPYGHSYQHTVKELRDPNIKLIPLIEPGTGTRSDIAAAIAQGFGDSAPMDLTNATQLSTLDVIATADAANMLPEALVAVETVVKNGVGLLHWGNLGAVHPGFEDPIVTRLGGLSEAGFGSTPDKYGVELEVVAEHPILGGLKPGRTLKIQASGAYGTLQSPPGVPLVRLSNPAEIGFYAHKPIAAENYYLIYTSSLGKGRIVGCSFPAFRELPPSLNRAVGGRFLVRCVTWLAEKSAMQ